jgi:hypothetical protein
MTLLAYEYGIFNGKGSNPIQSNPIQSNPTNKARWLDGYYIPFDRTSRHHSIRFAIEWISKTVLHAYRYVTLYSDNMS